MKKDKEGVRGWKERKGRSVKEWSTGMCRREERRKKKELKARWEGVVKNGGRKGGRTKVRKEIT